MDTHSDSSFSQYLNEKHVTRAWMAATISAGLTLIFGALASAGVMAMPGVDAWVLIDGTILAVLAYGVWKRSRVCALLLLLYGMVNEIGLAMDETERFSPLRLVFIYFYFRGAIELFRDHRKRAAPQDANTDQSREGDGAQRSV